MKLLSDIQLMCYNRCVKKPDYLRSVKRLMGCTVNANDMQELVIGKTDVNSYLLKYIKKQSGPQEAVP